MDDTRSAASDGHTHDWVPLGLGFEMCTICRKIRRIPKLSTDLRTPAAKVTQPHPRRIIGPLIMIARHRILRHRGGGDAR